METEAISIDEYLGSDDRKKFDFIYENYSIIKPLMNNYRQDLITDVQEMKSYNRRAANGDPGVRVQISIGHNSPAERQALNDITIGQAIDEGCLDDDFFADTDDQDELVRRVTIYHSVTADYETFKSKINELELNDRKIIVPYLLRQKTLDEMATEWGIEYHSAAMRIYRIRKKLSLKVEPRLRRIM